MDEETKAKSIDYKGVMFLELPLYYSEVRVLWNVLLGSAEDTTVKGILSLLKYEAEMAGWPLP